MKKESDVKKDVKDFPVQDPAYSSATDCLSPKDIGEAQKLNEQMIKISHKAKYRFAFSIELSQGLVLKKTKVHE